MAMTSFRRRRRSRLVLAGVTGAIAVLALCAAAGHAMRADDGDEGLLAFLEWRLEHRGHAVVVVAEGCGKQLADGNGAFPS